ncbi:MAG: hypothetical protein OEY67_08405 [Gammaproteobacteria bacterium]|nr:hypothetical protein [Gammaproteobacteria bacterium]
MTKLSDTHLQQNRAWHGVRLFVLILPMLAAMIYPVSSLGDGLSILLNGRSWHLEKKQGVDYNETNLGTGFQYDFSGNGDHVYPFINAGGFKDSFENNSYYAGGGLAKRFMANNSIHIDAGVTAFLMTRKDRNDGDPFPGMLPFMTIGTDKVAVNITYIPKVDPKMVPLFFIQLKISLTQ